MAADKAFVEYMNASTPEEVTVNLNVGGNSYEIAWIHDWRGDGLGSWRWVGEAEATGHGEAIDRALESIPGPFIEGGIDENGNAYAIHPETGERIIASKINMPGWGEMTIVELLQMDPEELKGHITELMGRAGATDKLIAGTAETPTWIMSVSFGSKSLSITKHSFTTRSNFRKSVFSELIG